MAHHHKHSHNLKQEVIVAKIFWLVMILYFALELFLAMSRRNLLGAGLFESAGLAALWQAIVATWLTWFKPVFLTLNAACIIIAIFSAIKVWPIRPHITVFKNPHAHGGHGHGESSAPATATHNPMVLKHWTDIVRRANSGTPENLRWAIMESDALVDSVLKERGLPGETMADRLANFRRDDMKSLDRLWDAHRLRNDIAHTPGFKFSNKQAEKALFAFRDFLKELKAF